MRLSTRSRYGVRLLCELAAHYGKDSVILKEIAQAQDISEKYLSQLIIPLKGAGLVQGNRGAHGGYKLTRHPSHITIQEIVEVLEGDLCLVQCSIDPTVCKRSGFCASRDIWVLLKEKIVDVLSTITLEDLVKKQKNKELETVYSI